jgi:hypothetical protein
MSVGARSVHSVKPSPHGREFFYHSSHYRGTYASGKPRRHLIGHPDNRRSPSSLVRSNALRYRTRFTVSRSNSYLDYTFRMMPLGKIHFQYIRPTHEAFMYVKDDTFQLTGYFYRCPNTPVPMEHYDSYWSGRNNWFESFWATTYTYKGTLKHVFKPSQLLTLRRAIDTFFAAIQKF